MTARADTECAFPREEFDNRLERTRSLLADRNLGAGLFFAAESIYYLTGYDFFTHGSGMQLLVVPLQDEPFMVVRQHFASGVEASTYLQDCLYYPDTSSPIEAARDAIVGHRLATARLGLEETATTLTVQTARALEGALSDAKFGDCSGIVEELRLVKSPREIQYVQRAARISDIGMEAARAIMVQGIPEREIATEVTQKMMAAGGEYQSVPIMVGIEERGRLGAPAATSRRLGPGELLWLEVFGTIRRYAAGLKANFGAKPLTADMERRFETAQRALKNAIAAIAPGKPASVIPEAVHETFREAGYGETPYHQSGYSIGITFPPNLHEARMLSLRRGNSRTLEEGMTLFPIANLYGPGTTIAGSAMVVVNSKGAEVLTKFVPSIEDLAR